MNKASDHFIPAGRIQQFQPTLPGSAKSLADERNLKRGLNHADETLNDLEKHIKKLVVEDKRTKWQSTDDKCDHRTGTSHLWRLVKSRSGKTPHNSPNMGVRFADKTYLDPKMIVNKFAHQFTPPPICLTGDMSKRQFKRQFHLLPLAGTRLSRQPSQRKRSDWPNFTAIGPDRMNTIHLKKLAHGSINYLTNIFNLSNSTRQIPEIWHKAIIIPIQKSGKNNNIGMNWRPISLRCSVDKTLETLLLAKVLTHFPFHPA